MSRLRQLTNIDLQGGQLLHRGPQSQSGQQSPPPSPADDIYLPRKAGGAEGAPAVRTGTATPAGQQEAGGSLETTPAVTRRAVAGGLSALVTERTFRKLQQFNHYTDADLLGMAHEQQLLTFAEDVIPPRTRNSILFSEGETRSTFLTTLRRRGSWRRLLSGRQRKTRV